MNITPVIEPPPSGFDYSTLDVTIAETVRSTAHRIKTRARETIIDTGRDLLEVKAMLDHGTFGPWLNAEFGWTPRTAQNYMSAAALADSKSEIVSYLPAAALYRLAAPSTPDSVRDNVVTRIQRGESISSKDIDTLAASARREQAAARRKARMSPKPLKRTKQLKEEREAKRKAEAIQLQKRIEERKQAALDAVAFLRHHLGDDLFVQFAELCRSPWDFEDVLHTEAEKVQGRAP